MNLFSPDILYLAKQIGDFILVSFFKVVNICLNLIGLIFGVVIIYRERMHNDNKKYFHNSNKVSIRFQSNAGCNAGDWIAIGAAC